MSIIEISGSTGFVGENLVSYLNHNFQVKRTSLRYIPNQQITINGDVFVHLAGKAHDLKKVSKPEDYYDANFELVKQVFDAFLASKANVFILVSSVKAVADEVEGMLTEVATPSPATHYGKSKLLAEQYLLSKKCPDEKKIYILRPCMIHGMGNKGNLNLLFSIVQKGIPYPLGSFKNKRSLLSIENLCFVIGELINRTDIPSGVYNVADDIPLSTNRMIELMANGLHRKPIIWLCNKKLIQLIARLGDISRLPFNSERLQKLTESYVVDNSKIRNELNVALPVTSEEGLRKTIQHFIGK